MKTISSTQAQKSFGELVTNAIREPISITKHTKEIFVIVPSDEYHKMKQAYETFVKKIVRSKKRIASSYIGSAKGLFNSTEEVDLFISKERASWR
jgi:prevent-host-death family protein